MYRRYYPRYDRPGEEPQRPIGADISDDTDSDAPVSHAHNTEPSIMIEPEIIIPEKPVPRNEVHTAPKLAPAPFSASSASFSNIFRGFANIRKDDLLLLALVLMLFLDGVEDEMLLLILVFLFFIGF